MGGSSGPEAAAAGTVETVTSAGIGLPSGAAAVVSAASYAGSAATAHLHHQPGHARPAAGQVGRGREGGHDHLVLQQGARVVVRRRPEGGVLAAFQAGQQHVAGLGFNSNW